ncbi:MAG: tetratricopeptide repeat protein [Asgard group archaeon]|nr:tetratricopeptide repeat protein [Asgard group archaeon]
MSSTIEKSLQKIEQLLIHGEFQEALKIIENSLKRRYIKKEERLSFLVHKSDIQNELGKHIVALELAEEVLKESEKLDNNLLQIDALVQKVIALYYSIGQFAEGLICIEKGLGLLNKISDIPPKDFAKRKSLLLHWNGLIVHQLGDFEKNKELLKESLIFAEKSGNKRIIARCLTFLGFFMTSDEKQDEYFDRAYKTAKEIGNKLELAAYYITYGYILGKRREFDKSFKTYEKGFSLLDEIGSTLYYHAYNDLGLIYSANFQLDKALECFQKSLEGFDWGNYVTLNHIAYTYFMKYDLEQAQEYYLKSLKLCEEKNERKALPHVLFNLILISIELKNPNKAQQYLGRLEQISIETGFERINRLYRYASILLLKTSSDFSDWGQAEDLLKEMLNEDDLPSEWRLDLLYNLLEIHIKELQLSPSEECLKKVQQWITQLESEADKLQLRWLLANVYRLQSQLALVELDVSRAIELLDKAHVIAEEIEVEILKKALKRDREKIDQQLAMLKKFQERQASLSETVKIVSLESTVEDIKEETVLEERDKKTGEVIEYRKLFALKI